MGETPISHADCSRAVVNFETIRINMTAQMNSIFSTHHTIWIFEPMRMLAKVSKIANVRRITKSRLQTDPIPKRGRERPEASDHWITQ
jgi:hypothetical protein